MVSLFFHATLANMIITRFQTPAHYSSHAENASVLTFAFNSKRPGANPQSHGQQLCSFIVQGWQQWNVLCKCKTSEQS